MTNAINTSALNAEALAAAAAAGTAAKVKLTREEKLKAQYDNAIQKIEDFTKIATEAANELNAIQALAAVGEGSAVIITVGKGESAKEVTGTVSGVKVEEDGSKVYKVSYGSGFDADVAVVKAGKIKLPVAQAERDVAQAQQETQYA